MKRENVLKVQFLEKVASGSDLWLAAASDQLIIQLQPHKSQVGSQPCPSLMIAYVFFLTGGGELKYQISRMLKSKHVNI